MVRVWIVKLGTRVQSPLLTLEFFFLSFFLKTPGISTNKIESWTHILTCIWFIQNKKYGTQIRENMGFRPIHTLANRKLPQDYMGPWFNKTEEHFFNTNQSANTSFIEEGIQKFCHTPCINIWYLLPCMWYIVITNLHSIKYGFSPISFFLGHRPVCQSVNGSPSHIFALENFAVREGTLDDHIVGTLYQISM